MIGYQNLTRAFVTRLPDGHFQWLVSTEHGQQTGIADSEDAAIDRCDELANVIIHLN